MKLKVQELTRAEREGRTHRGKVVPVEATAENGEEPNRDEGSEEEESEDEDGMDTRSFLSKIGLLLLAQSDLLIHNQYKFDD